METRYIQTAFTLPRYFNEEARATAARMIIEKIQENTSRGLDRYGASFKKYSNEYTKSLDFKNAGKTKKVNLELTGDMMASLELISSKEGQVVIGYKTSHPDAGKVEGNQIGSYGGNANPSKARPFIGLPQSQLDLIIATVSNLTAQDVQITKKTDGIVQNLLNRFF